MTHEVDPGTDVPLAGAPRGAVRLAGGLLSGAGLVDVVAGIGLLTADPYVVVAEGAIYQLDITGWSWLHLTVGIINALAGLAVATGRRETLPVAVAAAALGITLHLMVFPYHPVRAVAVTLMDAAAIRLLVRYQRTARRLPPL